MYARSACTTGLPARSGFGGMIALFPTASPPRSMAISMCSSVTEDCHAGSRKSRGGGFSPAAAGPLPEPSAPWHIAQRIPKSDFASFISASEIAPPDLAAAATGCRDAVSAVVDFGCAFGAVGAEIEAPVVGGDAGGGSCPSISMAVALAGITAACAGPARAVSFAVLASEPSCARGVGRASSRLHDEAANTALAAIRTEIRFDEEVNADTAEPINAGWAGWQDSRIEDQLLPALSAHQLVTPVRLSEEILAGLDPLIWEGSAGDPHARHQRSTATIDCEIARYPAEAFGGDVRAGEIRLREEHHEFIDIQPEQPVRPAKGLLDSMRYRGEVSIAVLAAQLIPEILVALDHQK